MTESTKIENIILFKSQEIESIDAKIKNYKKKHGKLKELNEQDDQHYFMMISWKKHLEKELEKIKKEDGKENKIKIIKNNNSGSVIPKNNNSPQMDLFRSFVAPNNDDTVLSNLIYVWDLSPKYIVSRRDAYRQKSLDKVKPRKAKITLSNDVIDIEITPALIEEDEVYVVYFPSETEEIIEHVMRKILLEQNYGIHSNNPQSTWVKFTVRMVQRELKKLGKTRSHKEIIKSIEILSKCNIRIRRNGQVIQSGAIFKEKIDASNQEYSDQANTLSAIQLPEIITTSINRLEFKQYNYYLTNRLNTQLTRWIMRRLSLYFTNAGGMIQTYKIKYSEIYSDSCLLADGKHIPNRKKIDRSINELVKNNILYLSQNDEDNKNMEYEKNGKTIKDITYLLHPSTEFVKHMVASNKRNKELIMTSN